MVDADYGRLGNRGMSDREVFQIDRRNPFAAGFDHILRAIGDPHVSVLVDGGDVAGVEIAVVDDTVAVAAVRLRRYRAADHLPPTQRPAPPQLLLAGVV